MSDVCGYCGKPAVLAGDFGWRNNDGTEHDCSDEIKAERDSLRLQLRELGKLMEQSVVQRDILNRQNSELKDALHEVLIGLRRLDCDNRWREEIEDAGKLLTEKRDGFTPIPGLPDCVSCHHGGKLCGYHDKREGVRPPPKCDACEWHHYKDEPHGKRQVSS